MAKASAMKPRSGGVIANAKAQPPQRQNYGKQTPSKRPGLHNDAKSKKGSPLARKGKK